MSDNKVIDFEDYWIQLLSRIASNFSRNNQYYKYINDGKLNKNYETLQNSCKFLDENKVHRKFRQIYDEYGKRVQSNKPPQDESNKKILNQLTKTFLDTPLSELYNTSSDLQPFINQMKEKIENITGVNKEDLKIKDLNTFFSDITQELYFKNISSFYQTFLKENEIKESLEPVLKRLKNYNLDAPWNIHNSGRLDNKAPFSYLFKRQRLRLDTKNSNYIFYETPTINEHSSEITLYPNISIFCTRIKNKEDIESNLFSLFAFSHELGHVYAFKDNTTVNFFGRSIKVPNSYILFSGKFSENISKKLDKLSEQDKKLLNTVIPNFKRIFNKYVSFNKYLDLAADMFSIQVVINVLKNVGKSDREILLAVIDLLFLMRGADDDHFSGKMRAIFNIEINPFLKEEYEKMVNETTKSREVDAKLEGSRKYYTKYIKYKTKYINLKNKLM